MKLRYRRKTTRN